jgi:hypothetical protein
MATRDEIFDNHLIEFTDGEIQQVATDTEQTENDVRAYFNGSVRDTDIDNAFYARAGAYPILIDRGPVGLPVKVDTKDDFLAIILPS